MLFLTVTKDPIKCKKCKGVPQIWYKKTKRIIEYWVECNVCGLRTKLYRSKADAIKEWESINIKKENQKGV